MKGLIYKDFLCLRKALITASFVMCGTILMTVMILLSCRYGNLARDLGSTVTGESIGFAEVKAVLGTALYLILAMPIFFAADVANCFREDARAGFGKTLSGMSLTHRQIVGSRYITTLIYLGAGILVSLVATLLLTFSATGFETGNYMAVVATMGAGFAIYMSIALFFTYLLGATRADMINIFFIIVALIASMWFFFSHSAQTSVEEMDLVIQVWSEKITGFLQNGYWILIPIAVITMLISYAGSVEVLKRRRGIL